eukprot:6205778-Pleurochrysis_carterae.AAC.2
MSQESKQTLFRRQWLSKWPQCKLFFKQLSPCSSLQLALEVLGLSEQQGRAVGCKQPRWR